jgi:hypothetical protein
LPADLIPGTYQLRAYTNYQRNFGTSFFFKKNIPVFSVGSKNVNWYINAIPSTSANKNEYRYSITLLGRKNKPQKNIKVKYKIKAKRIKTIVAEAETSEKGSFEIAIKLPQKKQIENCNIELSIEGNKQLWSYELPMLKEIVLTRFFPEGGNFAEELKNRVAYKITNRKGVGIKAEMNIFNSDSILVVSTVSNQFGLGAFFITPQKNKQYFAAVKYNNIKYQKYLLPQAQKNSYTMFVENQRKDNLYVQIAGNGKNSNTEKYTIVCQSKGVVVYTLQGKTKNGKLTVKIPKKVLPPGICQVTFFNSQTIPQSERLVFIKKKPTQSLEIVKKQLPDGTYRFSIKLDDHYMKSANISLSMINRDILDNILPWQGNIRSYLELTSELCGNIENSGYYFMDDSLKRVIYLDYLLMTQGWRKFVWKEMVSSKLPKFNYSVERAIKVSGTIRNYSNRIKTGDKITMMLYENKKRPMVLQTVSDSVGRFVFYTQFKEVVEALIQTQKQHKRRSGNNVNRRLIIETRTSPSVGNIIQYTPDNKTLESISKIKNSGQVRKLVEMKFDFGNSNIIGDVTVSAIDKKKRNVGKLMKAFNLEEMEAEIASRNNYEYPNIYYFLADNFEQATLSSKRVMKTMRKDLSKGLDGFPTEVGGSGGSGGAGGKSALMAVGENDDIVLINNQEPLYVVNGDPMIKSLGDYQRIALLDWHSLKSIKIYDTGANQYNLNLNEDNSFRPVVVLELNDDGRTRVVHTGMRKIKLTGYYRARKFFHPIMSEDVKKYIPEYRSTVYWNPELKCDSSGVFSFHLKRRFIPQNLEINIEGITDYGVPICKSFSLK